MRILLTQHGPLRASDSGRWTAALAQALAAAGHLVHVLIVDSGHDQQEIEAPRITVRRMVCAPGEANADLDFAVPSFTSEGNSPLAFEALSDAELTDYRDALRRHLDSEIDQFNPHLVHAQHIWIQGQLALETGVPYILSAWGPEMAESEGTDRFRHLAEQAADNASRILVVSDAVATLVRDSFEDVAGRLVKIAPAVAITPLPKELDSAGKVLNELRLPEADGALVVCLATASLDDGLEELLNAAARYENAPSQPTTVILGVESRRGELELHARQLGLERVHLVGILDGDERPALLAAADLVVLPTRHAGQELTAVEALAHGAPVVATAESGLGEFITAELGLIIPAADHEQLAAAIEQALDEDWKSTRGAKTAQIARESYSFERSLSTVVALYEAVLIERFGSVPK